MIKLIRLNGEEIVINADLIEIVKSTPDTIIKLTTDKKIIVKNTVDEVIKKVIDYKKNISKITVVDEE